MKLFQCYDTGRIAGNPATDVFAGMNAVSDYGNLEKVLIKELLLEKQQLTKTVKKLDKPLMILIKI
jgi:hypothetical protein